MRREPPPLPSAAGVQPQNAPAKPARIAADAWPRHTLHAERVWQLNLPGGARFDASALLELPDGTLLTLADRGPTLFRIEFAPGANTANLVGVPDCFTPEQLAPYAARKTGRYDSEGLARDEAGRIYLCEEADRWILRWDPQTRAVERLGIDWTPVQRFFSVDRNASFEGVAVGGGRLYAANERSVGRIIVVELATLAVVEDFSVKPMGITAHDVHYSDLCWFEGTLFCLLRESRKVLGVEPATHRVLVEFDYSDLERDPEYAYFNLYPSGLMEGLAVDNEFIWLVTDNNGMGRVRYPRDTRPTLFRCRRPDR
jgi:hypothetical protein